MKKVFRFGLVLISLLTLFSCNPFSVDDDDDYAISAGQKSSPVTGELQNNAETGSQNLQPQKALIQVVFNDGSSRTVLPSIYLKNFVLTGKRNSGEEQELAKAATKSDWSGKSIEILTGDWEFTMSAEVADGSTVVDGVTVFKDTQAVSVGSGANVLSFVLKPFKSDGTEVSGGELSVTLSLDPEAKADKARAVLKASDGTEFTKDYPDSGKLSQGASITFQKSNLPADTYNLEIEFYSENENGDKIKQNSWMAIVRIAAGLKSSATVQNFNLNEVYKITYETNGGTLATGVHILSYSRKSEAIELATCTKTGFLFMGWYETANPALADVLSAAKTNFSPQTEARNKTFYALWTKNTVYVEAGGSGNGFSSESPVGNFTDAITAIGKIKDKAGSAQDFTIKVCGEVMGKQTVSSSLTTEIATTLTIEGETGNATDSLNGNNEGTTLTVATAVPVTIKNLLITGGYAENGGGIYNSGTLSLADGCLVSKNTATKNGGGVYSTGTMFMYGSAVIGDSSKTTAATKSESTYSNKAAAAGGGIYSTGNLYLGFSSAGTATLTGGVYYNFAKNSGGIYQIGATASKEFKLNSGSVLYNAERGIYVGKGNFTMTGGIVSGNTALDEENEDSWRGAGIYVGADCNAVISGGTISSNKAAVKGGGIHIAQSSSNLTIEGGTISENTADSYGSGISMDNGSLKMQGGALVDSSNDVYLPSGKKILVTGKLTAQTQPIAKVTPATWTRGTTIVQTSGTNIESLKKDDEYDYTNYFVLSDTDWVTKLSTDNKSITIDAPIYVSSSGKADASGTRSNPRKTLEQACELITDSSFDYTIYIAGTLTNVQTISSSSISAASITIKGTDASAKIDLSETGPALTISVVDIPITILNLTITKGETGYHGGGIHIPNSSTKVILGDGTAANGVLITANKGNQGGGIYNAGTLKIYEGVHISNNTATLIGNIADGAGIYNTGELHMFGGQIYSNTAGDSDNTGKGDGGGVLNSKENNSSGTFNFQGGKIYGNTAYNRGGGIYNNGGTVFMSGNAVVGDATKTETAEEGENKHSNFAYTSGGGIYSAGESNVYVGFLNELAGSGCSGGVCYNYAKEDGGGIYGTSADVTIQICDTSVSYNGSSGNGGGIYNQKSLTVLSGTIEGNSAEYGGGIYNSETCYIYQNNNEHTYIRNNFATSGEGGGIYNIGGVTMNAGTISGNTATGNDAQGAGVFTGKRNSVFTMTGGEITGNKLVNNNTTGAIYISGGAGIAAGLAGGSGGTQGSAGTFTMTGGSIHGNICELASGANANQTIVGSGVYIHSNNNAIFNIGGSAYIYNDDVYLSNGKTITLVSSLTKHTASDRLTITPKNYSVETSVLAAEAGVTLANEVKKFTLSNAEWGINSSGSLFQYVTAANVAASLASLTANTVDTPHEIAVYASSTEDIATIKAALNSNSSKYVKITLSCSGITTLPESAFSACTSIVGITLPYGITGYGDYAFGGCSNLSELIFPESLTSTSYRALNGCTSLKSITLPESLETIGLQSFSETGLTSITIPKNVKSIPNDPFTGSTSLERVTVDPDNQNYKDIDGVLYNKSGSQLVYYPAARTGSYDIPSSVTQIGGYAFYKSKISGVTIPNTVTSIGRRAFENCDELSAIDLPSNLRTIEDEAFALCDNLTSVTIPKSVTSIGNNPFSGCSKVTEIIVEDGSSNFVAVGGVLFNKDKTLLKCYPAGKNGASYSIPDTVTTIGSWVFRGCSLTSITIPDSVDFIYDYAFYDCSSLTSLVFTDTSTWYQTRSTSRIGGTEFDVTNTATNASNFKSGDNSYKYYYKE